MSFNRRRLVTCVALAMLVVAGLGGRDAVHAAFLPDPQVRPSEQPRLPQSGEPDVGVGRLPRGTAMGVTPKDRNAGNRELTVRQINQVRWVNWVWVIRYFGMGL